MKRLVAAWAGLPVQVRSAIVDAVESGLAAAVAVQVVVPPTAAGLEHAAITVFSAFAGAVISNLRRRIQAVVETRPAQ